MSKTEPKIQKFMTCQPHAIESEETLGAAQKMMDELRIRHLPVMQGQAVYGILSDRDIKMAMGLVGVDLASMPVKKVCHQHLYQVDPDTPLHEVVNEMAAHHYGCAVVVQNHKLVGIFTTIDACKVISWLLEQRFHTQT